MICILNIISENIVPILVTFVTGLLSYIGIKLKYLFEQAMTNKRKKEIVCLTVDYTEQVYKNTLVSSEDKYNKTKEKALEWLSKEKINVSDTELEILIESAVNHLKEGGKC